jgi:hypothetical protein
VNDERHADALVAAIKAHGARRALEMHGNDPRRRNLPNPAAVIRLVGAVLADMHDERQAGDRPLPLGRIYGPALPRQR